MRVILPQLIILLIVGIGADIYIYKALRRKFSTSAPAIVHVIIAILAVAMLVTVLCLPVRTGSESVLLAAMWLIFGYTTIYISKWIYCIFSLIGRLPRIWHHRRWRGLGTAGVVLAAICFVFMWWSAIITRTSLHVSEVTVEIPNLPAAFDGYTIAQFSDAHVGTYGADTAFVSRAVNRINSLNADVIVFTGDIVNRRTVELMPHKAPLSRLSAPDGVMAILGNHDYGDYSEWADDGARQANMQLLYDSFDDMGWQLLRDDTRMMHRGNDSIAIIGVENVGDAPFPSYGSLSRAYPKVGDNVTKILLTHNPAHWGDSISGHSDINVALTLSGHTHAMQCKVFGWSPAVFRYPLWGGLYESATGQQLYINIGLGTVGMPVRIGQAVPEITLITLKRKP